ncbi:grasp-with-spasm system SPASM domain peptide maturase [Roseivirga sp. BDSF3-8]|uniref:grasp-with-spasm system SPASM domain peptide maturase n=1 Tax=Roseivirga sp. BDSF3-8 TaxID=3241598 RepID=UPI003532636B
MTAQTDQPYFILFANCIPVKGATRSVICDIQRYNYDFIPNALYDMLTEELHKPVREIAASYGEDNIDTVLEYFEYLEEKEYGFFGSDEERALFPNLNLEWDHPSLVTNAIMDIDAGTRVEWVEAFARQLDEARCEAMDIRIYQAIPPDTLAQIVNCFKRHTIESIMLYLPWAPDYEALYDGLCQNLRLKQIVVHGCPTPEDHSSRIRKNNLVFIKKAIDSHTHCGAVSPNYFSPNKMLFTESQKHNSCLNRKVSMDTAGYLCQCPSMPARFGHIDQTLIKNIISEQDFSQVWHVHKDQIDTCKDCEFRHICTDCRAWRKNEDMLSKPDKCHYDPYSAEWLSPEKEIVTENTP